MKLRLLRRGLLLGIFMFAPFHHVHGLAAEDLDQASEPEQQADPTFTTLPPPLDGITGNVTDLEESGHFKIISAEIGRTRVFQEEALIWTVNVVRPIACRHAQILFRRVGDVRFYRFERDAQWRRQLLATRLYYPQRIDSGAANRESLNQDEQFQIWIPLKPAEVDMLQHHKATTVVFSHVDRRTILEQKEPEFRFPVPETRF